MKLSTEALQAYNSALIANRPVAFARIRELDEELAVLVPQRDEVENRRKGKRNEGVPVLRGEDGEELGAYHANLMVQNRQEEKRALVGELRSKIRVVVDNSGFWL